MDAMNAMTALHKALTFGKDIRKIDEMFGEYRQALEWATPENPSLVVHPCSVSIIKEAKKRAETINAKLNRRVAKFQKHIDRFANTHHISPILSSDLPNIHIGFTKSGRWGDVKGNDVVRLQYPEWFQALDLPAPKQARKVFG